MDSAFQQAPLAEYRRLPEECRHAPATESQLRDFEKEFGPIPADFRWFLAACGGGVCGSDWIDGIEELPASHRKFRAESPGGWSMQNVFIIGWDGAGNPFGIDVPTGRVLLEDHTFGGIHVLAESLQALLASAFGLTRSQ